MVKGMCQVMILLVKRNRPPERNAIEINIPSGVSEGMYTTIQGEGNQGILNENKGDLIVYFEEISPNSQDLKK